MGEMGTVFKEQNVQFQKDKRGEKDLHECVFFTDPAVCVCENVSVCLSLPISVRLKGQKEIKCH